MEIRFKCPCGKVLGAPEEAAGKNGRCPVCERLIRVPGAESEGGRAPTGTSAPRPAAADPQPALAAALRPTPPHQPPPKAEDGGQGVIVVADSVQEDLAAAKKFLENHGYTVYAGSDGAEAIKLIRDKKPVLAIVDLKLDKISGFQVIAQVTDQFDALNKDIWQIPFIMTCGKVTGRDRQYAISLGVKYYYAKPVNLAKLCETVEKTLGRFPSGLRPR